MANEIYQVDAFAAKPFAGNSAAVCVMPGPADEHWMQSVAMEMNLSETAFIDQQPGGFNLRWFTPTTEVDLCGHATLASAHILWETGLLAPDEEAQFHTRSGLLTAKRVNDLIELNFPAEPAQAVTPPEELESALGASFEFVGRNRFDYLIVLDSEKKLRDLKPNFEQLGKISSRGFIVTSKSESEDYDFVSRFFAPSAGIDEDPVTGSAHCCLGPYWATQLGKGKMVAFQASARGGQVRVRLSDQRVVLCGQAVTVLRGTLQC